MKAVRLTTSSIIHPWIGDVGTQFLVEDDVAAQVVGSGFLEYVPGDEHNADLAVTAPYGADYHVENVPALAPEAERPRDITIEERMAELQDAEPLKRPYGNRPKSEWVAYAVQEGYDPDEASGLTKADLMSLYGERL